MYKIGNCGGHKEERGNGEGAGLGGKGQTIVSCKVIQRKKGREFESGISRHIHIIPLSICFYKAVE